MLEAQERGKVMNLIKVGSELQVALHAIEKARDQHAILRNGNPECQHLLEIGMRLSLASKCLCDIRDGFEPKYKHRADGT